MMKGDVLLWTDYFVVRDTLNRDYYEPTAIRRAYLEKKLFENYSEVVKKKINQDILQSRMDSIFADLKHVCGYMPAERPLFENIDKLRFYVKTVIRILKTKEACEYLCGRSKEFATPYGKVGGCK